MSKSKELLEQQELEENERLDQLYKEINRESYRAIARRNTREIMMDNHINPNPFER